MKLECHLQVNGADCPFVTPDICEAAAVVAYQHHLNTSHAAPGAQQAPLQPDQSHSKTKFDPPKLSAGSDQESWDYFLRYWDQYKATMAIVGDNVKLFFLQCMDRDLREDIYRAHPTAEVNGMTDEQLIEAVKSLAVKVESKLIHRIRMGEATQPPGTGIRNFLATLKGQAKLCQFKIVCPSCTTEIDYSQQVIQDQLVRGLSDTEILTDLMGDPKADRNLEELVVFIARKEQGNLEREKVSCGNTSAGAVATPPGTPNKPQTCWACQGQSHATPNNSKARQEHCS